MDAQYSENAGAVFAAGHAGMGGISKLGVLS